MRPARRRLPPQLTVLMLVGCMSSDQVAFSPADDDAAIAAITRVWSAPGSLTVSLCEDVAAPEPDNTCQVEHVVRGGGRGRRHTEDHSNVGCGGCPFNAAAYVTGTISGGAFLEPVAVTGEVTLGYDDGTDDPYVYPFDVALTCTDPAQPCRLYATLFADGHLEVQDPGGASGALITLPAGAPASCP